jgi:hypothetical protein
LKGERGRTTHKTAIHLDLTQSEGQGQDRAEGQEKVGVVVGKRAQVQQQQGRKDHIKV